jgi:hypothetical protein
MNFTETQMSVLKNFAGINASMIINPDGLEVINNSKSVIAKYKFDKAYDFAKFGIYEVPELLSVIASLTKPDITIEEKFLLISDGTSKYKYFTTALDLLPKVPDMAKADAVEFDLEFDISAEKLNMLFKAAATIKADFIFFETDKKKIRMTVANALDASTSSFDITLETGIKTNKLTKAVKVPVAELKLFAGDYKVKLSGKISKWSNTIGNLDYYVGTSVVV